jgi:hypothetical protein
MLNLVYHKVPPSCVLALDAKPKFSYGEKLDLAARMGIGPAEGLTWMIARGIGEWSLLDTSTRLVNGIEGAKGQPLEVTEAAIYDLDEETADFLSSLWDAKEKPDPKRGAPRSRR